MKEEGSNFVLVECDEEKTTKKKKRKLTSKAWDELTSIEAEDGSNKEKCIYCSN